LRHKPTDLVQKQALAAVGQALLMRYYDDFFSTLGKRCAQVRTLCDTCVSGPLGDWLTATVAIWVHE
jgi:glutamate 5-kinase